MKIKIALILVIVLILVAAFVLNQRRLEMAKVTALEESWAVLQEYLNAAKERDLERLAQYSYQLSDACKDPDQREECNARMDTAYSFGKEIKKEDLRVFGFDRKQIILASPYFENLEGELASITRIITYFVRTDDGIKFLSFNPFQGGFIFKGDQATSTVSARLWDMVADADKDGLPDKTENCEDAESGQDCIKTDARSKDSDGDGWWDSVETLFYVTESASETQ